MKENKNLINEEYYVIFVGILLISMLILTVLFVRCFEDNITLGEIICNEKGYNDFIYIDRIDKIVYCNEKLNMKGYDKYNVIIEDH